MTEMVALRNGTEESKALTAGIILASRALLSEECKTPMAFWDLVRMAQDKDYRPMKVNAAALRERNLLESDNSLHGSIKNIVLSSVEGEGLAMIYVNPVVR